MRLFGDAFLFCPSKEQAADKSTFDLKRGLAPSEYKNKIASKTAFRQTKESQVHKQVKDSQRLINDCVNGEANPTMITIIFKTGETQNKSGKKFKRKRKNAKLKSDKLCPQGSDEDKKLYP